MKRLLDAKSLASPPDADVDFISDVVIRDADAVEVHVGISGEQYPVAVGIIFEAQRFAKFIVVDDAILRVLV